MYKSDVYKAISLDIAHRMKDNNILNQNDYDDWQDAVTIGNYSDLLPLCQPYRVYHSFIEIISNWDGSDEEIQTGRFLYSETMAPDTANWHEFAQSDAHQGYAIITQADLLNSIHGGSFNPLHVRIIEMIWALIGTSTNNDTEKQKFWDFVLGSSGNRYLLLTTVQRSNDEEKWNAYCFGYFLYVNKQKQQMDSSLSFNGDYSFSPSIVFSQNTAYKQYFEYYNLISESHFCQDILHRYLVMYQILEHMCYRRHLAKIVNGNIKTNAFVRKSISIFSKGDSESKEIPKGFAELFPNIHTVITDSDITPYDTIIEEYYDIKPNNHSSSKIGKIMYNMRNSIVHNKASELHFSFGNIDEYRQITNLIRLFIGKIEPEIINLINNPDTNHPLKYNVETLDVY